MQGYMAEIIALGWAANLFVSAFINLMANTTKWITAKPFSCQMCMGFWIGLVYGYYKSEDMFIFALLSSLSAALIYTLIERINR